MKCFRFLPLTSLLLLSAVAASAKDKDSKKYDPSATPPLKIGDEVGWESKWVGLRNNFKSKAYTVERRINTLRKRLEEWGSVTVSAPIIMRKTNEFDLGAPTDFPNTLQYINLALTSAQGGVSQSTATAFSNQLQLTVTPTFAIDPLTGAKVARTMPTPDNSLTPDQVVQGPQFNLQSVFSNAGTGTTAGQFAAPGSLIVGPNGQSGVLKPAAGGATGLTPNSSFMLSGSQAAMIGSNAKISEMLMRHMANPPSRLFTNPEYQIHFAIVQISCNPGWRTRENYIADVSATCEYYVSDPGKDSCADDGKTSISPPDRSGNNYPHTVGGPGHSPQVFSVLPLIDAQTLELQNSERRFTQLAAALSAAYPTSGLNIKGQDIIQFVKQFQKDTQTVTPKTVANSYSSGSTFGFRLMPSLTALKDPARSGSKPANILQATSFPVLVTVVVSTKDVLKYKADSVRVSIANRWLINDRPPLKEIWRRIGLPMQREGTGDRINLTMDYGEAAEDFAELKKMDYCLNNTDGSQDTWHYHGAILALEHDLHELRNKVLGADNPVFCLPRCFAERKNDSTPGFPTSRPVVQQIIPDTVTSAGKASIFLSGLNFFCVPTPGNGSAYIAPADAKDSDESGIFVQLGQIKGLVRMCNGDDQMVVEFDGLDQLTKMESAALVIRTSHGAIGWGKAITVKAPAGGGGDDGGKKATAMDPKTVADAGNKLATDLGTASDAFADVSKAATPAVTHFAGATFMDPATTGPFTEASTALATAQGQIKTITDSLADLQSTVKEAATTAKKVSDAVTAAKGKTSDDVKADEANVKSLADVGNNKAAAALKLANATVKALKAAGDKLATVKGTNDDDKKTLAGFAAEIKAASDLLTQATKETSTMADSAAKFAKLATALVTPDKASP